MNLPQSDNRPHLRPDLPEESLPVLFHCGARVLFCESEVESAATIRLRMPTYAGAEPMHQPRDFLEHVRLENGQLGSLRSFRRHTAILPDCRITMDPPASWRSASVTCTRSMSRKQRRPAPMPRGGLFVSMSKLKNPPLPPMRADNLQANRQARGGESAWNRNGRQPPNIYRARVSQQHHFARTQLIGIFFEFSNCRCCDRSGWRYQHVYIVENVPNAAANRFQLLPSQDVIRRAHVGPGANPSQSFGVVELRERLDPFAMVSIGFRALQGAVSRNGDFDLPDFRCECLQDIKCMLERGSNLAVQIVIEKLPRYSDPHLGRGLTYVVAADGNLRADRILLIVPCDRLQDGGSIGNSACNRSHMIERPGKRNHTACADPAVGRFQSHYSALRCWLADRTRGIGADRAIADLSGDRCSRSS